jgi:hypothetical protein
MVVWTRILLKLKGKNMKKNRFKLYLILIVIITISSIYCINKYNKKKIKNLNIEISQLNHKIHEQEITSQTLTASLLKKYDTYDINGPLNLIRLGKAGDGGYVAAEVSLSNAQALLGYGISDEISFEEEFSDKYNKPSYGYECSINDIKINNPLFHFIPECLGTNKFSDNPIQSKNSKNSTFNEQIKSLNLVDKKVFIKMDIEGAEYEEFDEILNNANNITGIVMEIHLNTWTNNFEKAISLLSAINQNFYLVNIHGNNCSDEVFAAKNSKGDISRLLQLTYVNKNLVKRAYISEDQSHPSKFDLPNCSEKEEHKFTILKDNKL